MILMLSLWQIEKLTHLQSHNYTYRSHCTRTIALAWLSLVTSVTARQSGKWDVRSRFKLITSVGMGGSRNGFYKTFHLVHFQFIKCFKRLNFITWFFLFIFLEKSRFKLHYVAQCNFPSPPINKTPTKHFFTLPLLCHFHNRRRVWHNRLFKDGGVSRGYCHRWRNKRSLCG